MEQNDLPLRTLLIDIGNRLSMNDRAMLTFLLDNDVPRRDLDTIAHDSRASMNLIWDALINRQKITADNVDYLILCFEKINRMDIVRLLKQYSTTSKPENPVIQSKKTPNLFTRIDP